eukprot:g22116.t1
MPASFQSGPEESADDLVGQSMVRPDARPEPEDTEPERQHQDVHGFSRLGKSDASSFQQENEGENEDLDERVARANDDEEIRSGNRARESGVDSPGPDLDRGHREHSSSFSVSGSGAFPGQELTSAENGLAQAGVAIKHADEEDQAEQDTEGTELDKDGLPSAPDQLLVSSGEEAYEKGIKDEVDLDDDQPAQERDSAQPGKGSLGDAAPEDNDEDIPETNDMHPGRGSLLSGEKMGIGESNIIGNQANGLRGSQTSSKTIGFDSFDNPKEEASKKGGGFAEDAAVGLKPAADSIGTDTMEETKRTKLRGNGFTKERTADGLSPKSGSIPKATTAQGVEQVQLGIGGSKNEKLATEGMPPKSPVSSVLIEWHRKRRSAGLKGCPLEQNESADGESNFAGFAGTPSPQRSPDEVLEKSPQPVVEVAMAAFPCSPVVCPSPAEFDREDRIGHHLQWSSVTSCSRTMVQDLVRKNIRQIDSEYEFKEIIGEGSFGKVHKAQHRRTGILRVADQAREGFFQVMCFSH